MKRLLLALLILSFSTRAQEISIIPRPAKLVQKTGTFELNPETVLVVLNKADQNTASFLNSYLKSYYYLNLRVVNKLPKSNYIAFSTWNDSSFADQKESYQLIVDPKFVRITANAHAGTFYGMQTLLQMLPVLKPYDSTIKVKRSTRYKVQSVVIEDEPRFAYRGMHLDVARHFFPVSYIKKYIDYLALHKLNTFHWHLTDDQGWRIEIKKHPKLTSVGGWRNGTIIGRYPGKGNDSIRYGGYYTQAEVREVVKYAAERFITVVPEIEMPGHASAAIAAYPFLSCFPEEDTKAAKGTAWAGTTKGKQVQQAWGVFDDVFCAGKETTFQLLQDILDEVMPLFPSSIIHIGGDECPKTHWKRCPNCQQRMKENGLKDEHELQSYFIQRMEKYINSKGKQIIGWDEILEGGLAPNASVMSWRGEKGGIEAAKQHHNVVMTPQAWCYFDHSQSRNEDSVTIGGYNPIEKTYKFEPVPAALSAEESKYILGGQANLWTEYIKNPRKVEYQVFPRMAALSEVLWTKKELRDSADFERRLESQFKRYDMWKVNYSKAYYQLKGEVLPSHNYEGIIYKLSSKYDHGYISHNKVGFAHAIMKYDSPILINQTTQVTAWLFDEKMKGALSTLDQIFYFNKGTGKKITVNPQPSPAYPGNGGAFGLVNGIRADKFASPEWLGWNGKEVEITIDLGKTETVKEVVLHVWKQEPSWIYLPEKVELIFSYNDERGITQFTSLEVEKPEEGWGENRQLKFEINPQKAFAVTIKLTPLMKIPEGRQGAGNPAWFFLDEVEIN
jgi:hexosaminidase